MSQPPARTGVHEGNSVTVRLLAVEAGHVGVEAEGPQSESEARSSLVEATRNDGLREKGVKVKQNLQTLRFHLVAAAGTRPGGTAPLAADRAWHDRIICSRLFGSQMLACWRSLASSMQHIPVTSVLLNRLTRKKRARCCGRGQPRARKTRADAPRRASSPASSAARLSSHRLS